MSLQKKLSTMKKGFEAQAPKEAVEIMHRATADLREFREFLIRHCERLVTEAPDFSLTER